MSLLNLLQGMQTILSITKNDRLLAFTPITFDISLLEIFLPLISGATCILTKTIKQQGIFSLLSVIKNTPITLMQTTPSTWSFLIEAGWRGNRTVTLICGGDTLLMPLAKDLLKRCKRLFHVYGPTETTIWSTCTQITQTTLQKQGIEIGKPIQNNYVFVLDPHGNLLPVGCKGKLYIGGCSVAAGYRDKALTEKAFKPIQISREMVQIKQEHASKLYYLDKLYYTGDIVQWNKSTNLTFTGRTDSQVKVRGFRVDLTEIEHVLLKTLSIKRAIVLLETLPDQDKKLIAYYVADKPVAMSVLKKQISSHLPYYMLPSDFIQIDKLPLTKHGKIDKQKLLAHQGAAKPVDRQLKQTHFTYFQQKVARMWKDVLSRTLIQPADDFFSCGGHSLLVLKLVNVIDKILGIKISLDLIIQYPQFIDFCDALEKHKSEKSLFMTQRIINFHDKKIPDPLIKLAEGHSKRPLFLFHPIGGTVFWYIKFASRLKKLGIFPIYAFQDPGILSHTPIFRRFDEMAECYSKIITTVQSSGPYYLAGASSGANMAVTVANMLYNKRQSIAFVGLFDGWAKYPRQLLQPNIFHTLMESQYSTLKEKFKRMGVDSMDVLFRIQMQRQQLLFDHKQTSIPFKINLYKSTIIAPIFKMINEKSNHWKKYCKNDLIIHNVPGDHETMFSDENVRTLAKIVFDDMLE
jgi:thioesterase domain-containing protein